MNDSEEAAARKGKKKTPPPGVDVDVRSIESFRQDPLNLNDGSARGQALLERSLEDYGFGRSLLADKNGILIAGNHTHEALTQVGGFDEAIIVKTDGRRPVIVQRTDLDITKDVEARELAIADNRIQTVSFKENPSRLAEYLEAGIKIDKWYRDHEIREILQPVEYQPVNLELAKEDYGIAVTEGGITMFREDAIFPSTNLWGIPDLREDMLSDLTPHETWPRGEEIEDSRDFFFIYGSGKLPEKGRGGVLAFYAYDNVFEHVWDNAVAIAERFVNYGWGALVAPDFTLAAGDPLVYQLWQIYRSRWVARFWQEAGLKVIPNLSSGDKRTWEFAHGTIPKKAPVVSMQIRSTSASFSGADQEANRASLLRDCIAGIEIVEPQCVLIYGGTEGRSWVEPHLPKGPEYIWLDSFTKAREKAGKIIRKKRAGTKRSKLMTN